MASPASSSLRFLDLDGNPLEAPVEWASCFVEVDVPEEAWDAARLQRNDRSLPLSLRILGGRRRILAEWPRSGTGHYELSLAMPGEAPRWFSCRVGPSKISPAAYAELLADLETRLPASIAFGLRRLGALTGIKLTPPATGTLAEEMNRLRRAIDGTADRPGLADVLTAVARDPHRVLASGEVWVRSDRARRVSPARFAQVVAAGRDIGPDRLPRRLPELRPEESVDVYENRLLLSFHEQVLLRLRRLRHLFAAARQNDLDGECERLEERLGRARRKAAFLSEVDRLSHLPERLTMVLLKRPEYRSAFEGYLELHRSAAVRLDDRALDAPLEELPSLYETWAVLQVVDLLLGTAAELGFEPRLQRIVDTGVGGVFVRVLRDGRPALVLNRDADGTVARVIPQRTYSPSGGGFRSISFGQRPDLAIEVECRGRPTEIFLFDPKYKLDGEGGRPGGRPKKPDIDTMHAYRDAIRDEGGRRAVCHASILYPGPSAEYGRDLGALSAVPGQVESLRDGLRPVLAFALRRRA